MLAVVATVAGVLAVGPTPLAAQVSLGRTTWQSVGTDEATGDRIMPVAPSSDASLSADGRFVVFESEAILAEPDADRPGDDFEDADIYRRDRDADEDGIFDEVGLDPVTAEVQTRTELVSVGVVQPVGALSCAPAAPDPEPVDFGPTQVGLSDFVNFICTAGGAGPVQVAAATYSGPNADQFGSSPDQCAGDILVPGQTCSVQVQYSPDAPTTAGNPHTATLNVPHNGAGSPATVALSGTAFANATLSCTPNAMSFGTVGGGSDGPDPETCVNNGPQSLTVGTPFIDGPQAARFVIASNNCGTLASGAPGCVIGVTFNGPNATATHTATLHIPHNGSNAEETVALTGSSSFLALRQPVPSKVEAPVPAGTGAPPMQCLMECESQKEKAASAAVGTAATAAVVGPVLARAPRSAPAQALPPPGTPMPADEQSSNPVVTGDGRLVAFESTANNLLVNHFQSDDVLSQSDVFVRDMDTGTTYLVSPSPATGHTHLAGAPSISADGTHIAFYVEIEEPAGCEFNCLDATIIHADITNLAGPVTTTPLTEALDTDFDGAADVSGLPAQEWAPGAPVISADGQHVAVEVSGLADDMIAAFDVGDDHWDRVDASVNPDGQLVGLPGSVGQAGLPPAMSGDGRLVLFTHRPAAAAAVPSQVRLLDRDVDADGTFGFDPALVDGWFQTVSEFAGSEGDDDSQEPSITPDGQYVSFSTRSSNLGSVEGGTVCDNSCVDILVRDRFAPAGSPLELATVAQFEEPADGDSSRSALAASGRHVAFQTFAENLLPGFPDPTPDPSFPSGGLISDDNNFVSDVYVREFTPELIATPDPLSFGTVLIGDSDILSVTFAHVGFGPLNPAAISITGAAAGDFAVNGETCTGLTFHQGDDCIVSVRYTPSASGTREAVLGVAHDGANSPATALLTGGAGPKIATFDANPDELVFPETLGLTTSAPATTTITNTGNGPLTVNAVVIEGVNAGDFAISANTCTGVVLAPGATCAVSVTFTPTAPGGRSAALRFDDTATGSPHLVGLRGAGAAPTLVVNPGVVTGGQVVAVTGTSFPPNRTLTLVWLDPVALTLGAFSEPARSASTRADGTFVSDMLVFPNSRTGGRVLLGVVEGFSAIQSVLVARETMQGPDFVIRS